MSQPNANVFGPTGGGNFTNMTGFQAYTPVLTGQTDNPVVTYTTQLGRIYIIGALVFFSVTLVSSTMTKTTLTDTVSVSLPFAAAAAAQVGTGKVYAGKARVENATAVANMVSYEIAAGASTIQFRNYTLAASSATMTYAVTTPGIGVLTNAITVQADGFYEF